MTPLLALALAVLAPAGEPPRGAAPLETSCRARGPVCPSYGRCEPYRIADARCVCRCAGDDPWPEFVRCCLLDLRKRDVDPDAAHAFCWGEATRQTGVFPLRTLEKCIAACAVKTRRCAEDFPVEGCADLPDAVEPLVALLDCTADLKLKFCAMRRLHDRHGAPALLGALRSANACVRAEAAHGLMRYDGPEVLAALLDAARDGDAHVRMWAAWSLGEQGDPLALPVLDELTRDRPDFVAVMAAEAVAKIEQAAAAGASPLCEEPGDGEDPGR
jgi:HEAT repeat protein